MPLTDIRPVDEELRAEWLLLLVANGHEPETNVDGTLHVLRAMANSAPLCCCAACSRVWTVAAYNVSFIGKCTDTYSRKS